MCEHLSLYLRCSGIRFSNFLVNAVRLKVIKKKKLTTLFGTKRKFRIKQVPLSVGPFECLPIGVLHSF